MPRDPISDAAAPRHRKPTDTVQLKLRLREELRAALEKSARAKAVSLNNEIINRLGASFDLEAHASKRERPMIDHQFIPNANPNLQMMRWFIDDEPSEEVRNDPTCVWVEDHDLSVVFDFFPIVGWRPFYSESIRDWCLSPVSFCEHRASGGQRSWMAIMDRATGQVFQREGLGCALHDASSISEFADLVAAWEIARRKEVAAKADADAPAEH